MEIKQLKPVNEERNRFGCWTHPEFKAYIDQHFNDAEWIDQKDWDDLKRYFNIETTKLYLDSSVSGDDWERMMDSCDLTSWNPIAPTGFFLIDIGFTEDDAEAIFARQIRESEVA